MKKRTVVVVALAAAALTALIADSANAVTTYTAVKAALFERPAVDTATGIVYSHQVVQDAAPSPWFGEYLQGVNPTTGAVSAPLQLEYLDGFIYNYSTIADLRVDTKTHTVWVALNNPYFHRVYEVNASTSAPALVRRIDFTGPIVDLAIDTGTGAAYATIGTDGGSGEPAPAIAGINRSTGAVTSVALPGLSATASWSPHLAFDSANSGLYVSVAGKLLAYSNRLSLASTLALGDSGPLTANGVTHTIYVVGKKLYAIAGKTNTLSASIGISSTGRPVIDPSISTLYVGTGAYSVTTGKLVGALPYAASSVNGVTHAIYSGSENSAGYVITRTP